MSLQTILKFVMNDYPALKHNIINYSEFSA